MLTVEGVDASYGRTQILWDVKLQVATHESVALIGPNGAGKSTVLKAICGLVRPSGGTVRFDGEEVAGLSTDKLVQRGLVYVPERMKLFPTMTVEENLLLGAYSKHARGSRAETLSSVMDLLPRLARLSKRQAHVLSGGEQQTVALGRGLMSKPRMLLSDEPLLGLDPATVEELKAVFVEVCRTLSLTLLFIEQNVEHALDMADQVYILESGHVVAGGASDEMRVHPLMKEVYLGA